MTRIRDFFAKVSDWLFVGKRLPIVIVVFLLIAVSLTVGIVYNSVGNDDDKVTAYVTIKGFGDRDFENRQIQIKDGAAVSEIFSKEYEDIYNDFSPVLILKNRFNKFLGMEETPEKTFTVKIDDVIETNLTSAYVYEGQIITIEYN
ncbi:MAG: hypothetical protein IJ408_03540 [Clostridia bacterium]|nr:hypothetical protein [Clostridia bacterium]